MCAVNISPFFVGKWGGGGGGGVLHVRQCSNMSADSGQLIVIILQNGNTHSV